MDRINHITQDCLGAVMQLRQAAPGALPPAEQVHQRMRAFVDEMLRRAADHGLSHQDAQDAAYAVVALIDETALSLEEGLRTHWMGNLLQFHYFQENQAGDGSFTRLEAVRRDARRVEVLRVYALCLLFGFQGRYRIRGGQLELMSLTEAVQHEVTRGLGDTETLSPRGARTGGALADGPRRAPLLLGAAAVLALAVLVYGGLRLALHGSVSGTLDALARPQAAAGEAR